MMRTNEARLEMKDMHEQALMALAEESGVDVPPGIRVRLTEEYAKAEHILFLNDTNVIFEVAKYLFNKKWVTTMNDNDIPYMLPYNSNTFLI